MGYSGSDVITVGRLVGAPALKQALAAPEDADLGVIISDSAFAIVKQGLTTLPLAEFRPADVTVKEFAGRAWIWVPGGGRPTPGAPAAPPPAATTTAGGTTVGPNRGVVISGGTFSGPIAAGDGAGAYQGRPLPGEDRAEDGDRT